MHAASALSRRLCDGIRAMYLTALSVRSCRATWGRGRISAGPAPSTRDSGERLPSKIPTYKRIKPNQTKTPVRTDCVHKHPSCPV